MTKYQIEDTYSGYRLSLIDSSQTARHWFDEGGHGRIEGLYAITDALWLQLRSDTSVQHNRSTDSAFATLADAMALLDALFELTDEWCPADIIDEAALRALNTRRDALVQRYTALKNQPTTTQEI